MSSKTRMAPVAIWQHIDTMEAVIKKFHNGRSAMRRVKFLTVVPFPCANHSRAVSAITGCLFRRTKSCFPPFEALGYDAHKAEFCHRRGVFFHNHRCTLRMACAQAVAMRGAPSAARRLVAAPRNQQPFRFDPHVFDRDFSHFDDVV